MKEVLTVAEAKAQLSTLIKRVLAGEEFVIERAGQPVARLVPVREGAPRQPGALRGRIRISPDFDELPDDLAEALGASR